MENTNAPTPNTDPAPERGRAWRIVAIVLSLHAALLGSVVLIQGCSKTDSSSMTADAAKDGASSVTTSLGESVASTDANLNLPGPETLTPEEHAATSSNIPEVAGTTTVEELIQSEMNSMESAAAADKGMAMVPEIPVETPKEVAPKAAAPVKYTVKKGDTLIGISRKYSVSSAELARANRITLKTPLKIGQKLSIPQVVASTAKKAAPAGVQASSTSRTGTKFHVVKTGENPASIARRYGVSVQSLMEANKITDPTRVRVSQKLIIPSKMAMETSQPPAGSILELEDLRPTAMEGIPSTTVESTKI